MSKSLANPARTSASARASKSAPAPRLPPTIPALRNTRPSSLVPPDRDPLLLDAWRRIPQRDFRGSANLQTGDYHEFLFTCGLILDFGFVIQGHAAGHGSQISLICHLQRGARLETRGPNIECKGHE